MLDELVHTVKCLLDGGLKFLKAFGFVIYFPGIQIGDHSLRQEESWPCGPAPKAVRRPPRYPLPLSAVIWHSRNCCTMAAAVRTCSTKSRNSFQEAAIGSLGAQGFFKALEFIGSFPDL